MKYTKEKWEDELYVDPRPLTEEDKHKIREFIKNYSMKKIKLSPVKKSRKKVLA